MRGTTHLLLAAAAVLTLGACEQKSTKKVVLGKKTADDCALTLDNLAGTQWVMLQVNPDKTETPNIQTRVKLYEEGGVVKAKYTVSSLSDVYTYNCAKQGEELICREEPKVKDWCQALVTGGGECTPETLRGIDGTLTDDQIQKGMTEAQEVMAKYRGTDKWDSFVLNNNNLGNKLQGIFYLRVDPRNCRLVMTDNYMTIFNGKRIEDSNPVGTNPFVQSDKTLMWEHCTDSTDLVAMKSGEFPKSEQEVYQNACFPNRGCNYGVQESVYYHYIGQDARSPEDGCTYSYDLWANWEPLRQDVPAQVVDARGGKKELRWAHTQAFEKAGPQVMEMIRFKTCNGKKEQVEVSCNMVLVQ